MLINAREVHRHSYRVDYFLHDFVLIVLLEDLFEIYILTFFKKKSLMLWVSSEIQVDNFDQCHIMK